jgi:hypothetical protein
MRIHGYAKPLNVLVWIILKRDLRFEEFFRGAPAEPVKGQCHLPVLDFVRAPEPHLSDAVVMGGYPVLQVRREARLDIVEHRAGHLDLFINESPGEGVHKFP